MFVISNAAIQDWEVQQFMASDYFDMRLALRSDASESYSRYVAAANQLLDSGQWVKNSQVCKVLGMKDRTGSTYWQMFKQDFGKELVVQTGMIRRRGLDY